MVVCCPTCDRDTHCSVEYHKKTTSDDDSGVWATDHYHVLRCGGCRTVFFYHQNYFSENDLDSDGNLIADEYIYPTPTSKLKIVHPVNDEVEDALRNGEGKKTYASLLYDEVCHAINNSCRITGMLGIRSLLGEVCGMKTGFNENFSANLDKLIEEEFLAPKQKDVFKAIINIGNSTVHSSNVPHVNTLHLCLLTIESLVVSLFIVPQHEEKLKKVAPPPKPPKAKKTAAKSEAKSSQESSTESQPSSDSSSNPSPSSNQE